MSGTSTTTFAPSSTTTREIIVTVLHRMEGNSPTSGTAFADMLVGQSLVDMVMLYWVLRSKYQFSKSERKSGYIKAESISFMLPTLIEWTMRENGYELLHQETLTAQPNGFFNQGKYFFASFRQGGAPPAAAGRPRVFI